MRQMIKNFCKCGITGWCLEVMFTPLESFGSRDWRFMGRTSILMFPIYGMAVLLAPIAGAFDRVGGACGTVAGKLAGRKEPGKQKKPRTSAAKTVRHGVLYMCLIFMAEYASGAWLKDKNMCPWDYSQCRANIHGLIRLDFAPLWFAVGLLFEQLTKTKKY